MSRLVEKGQILASIVAILVEAILRKVVDLLLRTTGNALENMQGTGRRNKDAIVKV